MRRDNKTRDVTRSPNWSQSERVNLGEESERIRFKDGKKGSGSRSSRYSATTNVWSMVSLLLLIGMIATVFFAFYNSNRTDGKFQYFSPNKFLSNISSFSVTVEPGDYPLNYENVNIDQMRPYLNKYRAYVIIDGYKYYSENVQTGSADILPIGNFYFIIDGKRYDAVPTLGEGDVSAWHITIEEESTIDFNEFPDLTELINSYGTVNDATSFFNAVGETIEFARDWFVYQNNLISSLLPWNNVVEEEGGYLESLWERGQS